MVNANGFLQFALRIKLMNFTVNSFFISFNSKVNIQLSKRTKTKQVS